MSNDNSEDGFSAVNAFRSAGNKLAVGDRQKDGTICIAVNAEMNEALFVPAKIFAGESRFSEQNGIAQKANSAGLHGHKDWRLLTNSQVKKLVMNWAKVAPKNMHGADAPWFWMACVPNDSKAAFIDAKFGYVSRGGEQHRFESGRTSVHPVPVVRRGVAF